MELRICMYDCWWNIVTPLECDVLNFRNRNNWLGFT